MGENILIPCINTTASCGFQAVVPRISGSAASHQCFTLGNLEKAVPLRHIPTVCTGFRASTAKLLGSFSHGSSKPTL